MPSGGNVVDRVWDVQIIVAAWNNGVFQPDWDFLFVPFARVELDPTSGQSPGSLALVSSWGWEGRGVQHESPFSAG